MKFIKKQNWSPAWSNNDDAVIEYQTFPWFKLFINIFGRQFIFENKKAYSSYLRSMKKLIQDSSVYYNDDIEKYRGHIIQCKAGEELKKSDLVYKNSSDDKIYKTPNLGSRVGERIEIKPDTIICSEKIAKEYSEKLGIDLKYIPQTPKTLIEVTGRGELKQ